MDKSECIICGVAFDVGYIYCREEDCPVKNTVLVPIYEGQTVSRAKKETMTVKLAPRAKKVIIIDPVHSRFMSVRSRAIKKGLAFDLDERYIDELIHSACIYCGGGERIEVDRKNPAGGYTKDNTVAACRRCNTIKNDVVTYDEMVKIAELLGWICHT